MSGSSENVNPASVSAWGAIRSDPSRSAEMPGPNAAFRANAGAARNVGRCTAVAQCLGELRVRDGGAAPRS